VVIAVKRTVLSSKCSIDFAFTAATVSAHFSFTDAASFSNILLMLLQHVKQHTLIGSGIIRKIFAQIYIMAWQMLLSVRMLRVRIRAVGLFFLPLLWVAIGLCSVYFRILWQLYDFLASLCSLSPLRLTRDGLKYLLSLSQDRAHLTGLILLPAYSA
jgi:hypothetical protein